VNLSSRPRVLQLQEGKEEMRGKINRTEELQRRRSLERGNCGGVQLKNLRGGGSSATKLKQEDKGVNVARALERGKWAQEKRGHRR
jgi:hypothetical protein